MVTSFVSLLGEQRVLRNEAQSAGPNCFAAKFEPSIVDVQHNDLGTGKLDKDQRGQANRAGADNQARVFPLHLRALDGMAADR